MRRLAGTALICSSAFVAIVALLSDAPALFYMGTALLATIATARFQAYLSVRGLKIERFAPELARIGEQVKVEMVIRSERNIRRPLIYVNDILPPRLLVAKRSPALPVAPDYTYPVRSEYSFRPRRRGVYRWSNVEAIGTDALGLVTTTRAYATDPVEMTVLPVPIPVTVDMPSAAGWGVSEASSGDQKGPGGEPRGIREYKEGDSLRHVHWRSSARTGILHVKEFEAGSHSSTAMFFQRRTGTDLIRTTDVRGEGAVLSSLDLMAGHALHLAENLLRQGAQVSLPQLEAADQMSGADRLAEIALHLAGLQANSSKSLAEEILQAADRLSAGSLIMAFMVRFEPEIPEIMSRLRQRDIQLVALLYDAEAFTDPVPKSRRTQSSARETSEILRAAGVYPVQMPSIGSAA